YFAARYGTSWFSNVSLRSIMPRPTYSLWNASGFDVSDLSVPVNACSTATRAGVERGATWINKTLRTGAGASSATRSRANAGGESAPRQQSTPSTATTNPSRCRLLDPDRMALHSKNAAVTHGSSEGNN